MRAWTRQPCLGDQVIGVRVGTCQGLRAPDPPGAWPCAPTARTSAGAAAPGPLLALHVLQLYDLHLGAPPLAPDVERHMGVLEQPGVRLGVVLVAGAQPPSGVPPGGGRGVHSDSHRR